MQIAAAIGGKVIAVDVSENALAAAGEVGAVHTINARTDDPVVAVRTLTSGGAQVSIDALGISDTCRYSVLSLRKLGRHVPLPIEVILQGELKLFGSFGMQGQRFGQMRAMCEAGTPQPGKVVHRRVGLEEVTDVLEAMCEYDTVGVVVIDRF